MPRREDVTSVPIRSIRGWLLRVAAAALALAFAAGAVAQSAPPPRMAQEAIARFEQAWGVAGMYVLELEMPDDPVSASRVNLQRLQHAAQDLRAKNPRAEITTNTIVAAGLLPPLLPRLRGEFYLFDERAGRFISTAGRPVSLTDGAAVQLAANAELRKRMREPNALVFERWKSIQEDPKAPELLRREIEARRFLLEGWESPAAENAAACQANLRTIAEALEFLAVANGKKRGDPVTIREVADTGLLETMRQCPEKGTYAVSAIGKAPTCSHGGAHTYNDPAAIAAVRRAEIDKRYNEDPNYPPAMALRARVLPPEEGLALIDAAVARWNDVPLLRIERISHLARAGKFDRIGDDIDYLLLRFPAAPILFEIELALVVAKPDPESEAEIAQLLADARPDLLSPQLRAIRAFTDAKRIGDAQRVYDRLVHNHVGYGDLLERPK